MLNDPQIRALKPTEKPRKVTDAKLLYLVLSRNSNAQVTALVWRQSTSGVVSHHERNHQGRRNQLLQGVGAVTNCFHGRVQRRQRLGGMLNFYHREAA